VTRARPAPALPPSEPDRGPPERTRHAVLVNRRTDTPGVIGKRVKHACRLDWYWEKMSLEERQYAAGLRLRADWLVATAQPNLVGRYDLRVPGRESFSDLRLAARRRVAHALAALSADERAVAIDVCGFDNWASGRLPVLRRALSALASRYRLPGAKARGGG
jgi:hypothetical protein